MSGPRPRRIPLAVPNISGREWEYVKEALDTGWVSSAGLHVEAFEEEFARATGASRAIAVASGTAALHLSLLAVGVRPGDEVVMPSLTFIAPANAVRYVGAFPAFVDVDERYWQMDAGALRRYLEDDCAPGDDGPVSKHTDRPVRAVLPVDILGHPVDLSAIADVAHEFGLAIVEDATESLGAQYRGVELGSITSPTCFSFNGNKLITTGGGGMVTTDDAEQAGRIRHLSTQAKDDELRYQHGEVGFNYRLTNVQAAIGRAQLERLDEFVAKKRAIANRYDAAFRSVPGIDMQPEAPWARSASWLSTALVDVRLTRGDPAVISIELDASGIQTRPLWEPLHRSAAHRDSYHAPCPVADAVHARALSLPCSTSLTDEDQERVIGALTSLVR